jgi:hypothetical protein
LVNDHGHFFLEKIFLIRVINMDREDFSLAELIVNLNLYKAKLAWHHRQLLST